MAASGQVFHAVGKRKTAIARIYMKSGSGQVVVNEKTSDVYFPAHFQPQLQRPFEALSMPSKFDIHVQVQGGGTSAQAEACMYGIAKALTLVDDNYRTPLKRAGLMTRDSRIVERKKIRT